MEAVKAHQDTMPHVLDKRSGEMGKPSLARACKDLLITTGKATEDQIKASYKSYDQNRNAAIQGNKAQNAVLAVNPELKVMLRGYKNSKGDLSRIVATYTKASAGVTKNERIRQLEAEVRRLTATKVKAITVDATPVESAAAPF